VSGRHKEKPAQELACDDTIAVSPTGLSLPIAMPAAAASGAAHAQGTAADRWEQEGHGRMSDERGTQSGTQHVPAAEIDFDPLDMDQPFSLSDDDDVDEDDGGETSARTTDHKTLSEDIGRAFFAQMPRLSPCQIGYVRGLFVF